MTKILFISLAFLIIPMVVVLLYTSSATTSIVEDNGANYLREMASEKRNQIEIAFQNKLAFIDDASREHAVNEFFYDFLETGHYDPIVEQKLIGDLEKRYNNSNLYENVFILEYDGVNKSTVIMDGIGWCILLKCGSCSRSGFFLISPRL